MTPSLLAVNSAMACCIVIFFVCLSIGANGVKIAQKPVRQPGDFVVDHRHRNSPEQRRGPSRKSSSSERRRDNSEEQRRVLIVQHRIKPGLFRSRERITKGSSCRVTMCPVCTRCREFFCDRDSPFVSRSCKLVACEALPSCVAPQPTPQPFTCGVNCGPCAVCAFNSFTGEPECRSTCNFCQRCVLSVFGGGTCQFDPTNPFPPCRTMAGITVAGGNGGNSIFSSAPVFDINNGKK